jgi:hypothetical protein
MVSRIAQLTIDVQDIDSMSRFWSEALGMIVDVGDDGACKLYPPEDAPKWKQTIWLQPVEEPKRDKVRVHLDLRPEEGGVEREVDRLIDLGAARADIGQTGEEGFTVLADPEGNEFCVLHGDPR